MRFPEFLKSGDTIGITAPSFGATTEPYISRFNEAVRLFKEKGYKIKIGETCYLSDGKGISTAPEKCARELEDFYLDEEVKAIISCGGGEMMCETAAFIDFDKIKNSPAKWFMGYSDNTNFIFPLLTKCNVASVYGPCISGFGKPWELPEEYALSLMEGTLSDFRGFEYFQNAQSGTEAKAENPLSPYIFTDKKELVCFNCKNEVAFKIENFDEEIKISGILAGGCLDVLENLCGTSLDETQKFNSLNKNVIWVLEACDLNPMGIRRAVWHLDQCGWFKNASGFVIGRPLAAWKQEMMGVDQYNSITDILAKYNVPLIMDADIGHLSPMIPLVMGSRGEITAKGNELSVNMKFV